MIHEIIYLLAAGFVLFSVVLNLFLAWYCRNLLRRVFFVSENMSTLVEEVVGFHNHLSIIHEMEIYYGDETLGELIRHSTGLIETLEDFEEIYTMFDETNEDLFEEVPDDEAENDKTTP